MKLSVTTIAWGKLKSVEEFEKVVREIRDIGFEGVGIEYNRLPNQLMREPEQLTKILKDVNLENGGSYSRTREKDIEWARRSKTPLFWVSVKERGLGAAISRLRDFTEKTSRKGITCAIHNELRSSFETQEQMEAALKEIRKLKLCIDTAHGAGAKVDTLGLIEKYPKRLALIHLKDLRKILPKSQIRFRTDFVNVGEGALDLKSVVKKLEQVGYDGQLMLEIEALANEDPTRVVKRGYEHISSML